MADPGSVSYLFSRKGVITIEKADGVTEDRLLEVALDDDLDLAHYAHNFRRMFGNERMDAVLDSVNGKIRFYGLTPTSMKLEGLDRHHRLIDSLRKLHVARGTRANSTNC
jgi:ribosomal protein S12 methylthiotransferase accessory factor